MFLVHRLLALILFALLGACSNMSRSIEPEPIFPHPNVDVDVSNLPRDSSNNVCIKSPPLQGGKIPSEVTQFAVVTFCAYQAQSQEDISYWMTRFVDKGISLSDYTCAAFFNQLESRRVEVAYSQANTNLAGTAVTAALAATESHTRAIFNVATLLAVTNGWFENYKANYILTPELGKLHALIQERLRAPIASSMREKSSGNGYRSFDDAKKDVISYDQLCSHKVLQNVVSESIAKAELQPFASGPSAEKISRANAVKLDLYQLASGGAAGGFSTGEFEALYVVATIPGESAKRVAGAKALVDLDGKFSAYVGKLGLDQVTPVAGVLANFQLVGELLSLEMMPDIQSIRARIDEKVRAAPAAVAVAGAAAPPAPNPVALKAQGDAFKNLLRSTSSATAAAPINFGYEVRARRP